MLNNEDFGTYFDNIRKSRKMSVADLCIDIVSIRQYKRYITGESNMPNTILVSLADRLKLSISELFEMYFIDSNNEERKIETIYDYIRKLDLKKAQELMSQFDIHIFSNNYNSLLFGYCKIIYDLYTKKSTDINTIDKLKKLINYEKCISSKILNFAEIRALLYISFIEAKNKNFKTAEHLLKVLDTNDLNTRFEIRNKIPELYTFLSQILGMKKDFTSVVNYSQIGIDFSIKHGYIGSLPHLFYFNALAQLYLGDEDKSKEIVRKCFYALSIQNNQEQYEMFKKDFEKEFKMTFDTLNIEM